MGGRGRWEEGGSLAGLRGIKPWPAVCLCRLSQHFCCAESAIKRETERDYTGRHLAAVCAGGVYAPVISSGSRLVVLPIGGAGSSPLPVMSQQLPDDAAAARWRSHHAP